MKSLFLILVSTLAGKFKIDAIPTVVVLKDGSEQERIVGVTSKKKISELLDKQLH